jgi:Leucine-rich repeat (LRR) protein
MKKRLFIAVATFLLFKTQAQTWVVLPDAHFVTYLHTIVPAAMHGDSLDTSNTLVTTTTHTINVNNKTIANLTGVQYFTSLTYLDCGNNQIASLPALPNSITYLDCSYTFLTSLPALPNSLKYFNCSNNSLTSLPVLPNSINYLGCISNSLTTLPTLPTILDTLLCGANHLTSLPSLPNSLIYLYCPSNSLTTLPTLPNTLQVLHCEANSLTNLPTLSNSLTFLNCGLNSLSSLPNLPNSLTYLECEDNSLTSLPALPNSLQDLYCNNNSLTSLPALPNSLFYLDFHSNNITCLPIIPSSVPMGGLYMQMNSFNCLPNYTHAMGSDTVTYPLCASGNSHGCPVAGITAFNAQASNFQLYPNPAQNNFTIETSYTDKQTISLYDVNGKLILTQSINGTTNFDTSNFMQGVYNICISSNQGQVNKRLVVVK